MKRLSIILALAAITLNSAAVERVERNYIQNSTTFEEVKESLVMDRKWVPYPSYSDRAGWDELMGVHKERIIKGGERYLDYQWKVVKAMDYLEFETSGNRKVMEDIINSNNSAIACLFAAELAEGRGRFIPQIINGVFHTCEMTSWSLSAHLPILSPSHRSIPQKGDNTLELTQGGMAQMFSWIYYFLAPEFDKYQPEFSRRLKDELKHRELDSYLERDDFWWMGFADPHRVLNNWTPWCTSNALISFMLIEDDRDRLAQAVWKGIKSVDNFLDLIKGDGGIDEGPSYWGSSPGKLYDYLNMLDLITGGKVTIYDNKMVRDMGEYIVRSYVGDGWVVNFADASARGGADGLSLIYRYGKAVGSDLMCGYACARKNEQPSRPGANLDFMRFLESLRVEKEFEAASISYEPSSYTWYPETEFHYMSNKEGMFFAGKGGYNEESHNHNDVGTFNLYCDNLPIIIDVGVGTYTRQTFTDERYKVWVFQSSYHNLPDVNGVAQNHGWNYKARSVVSTPDSFTLDLAEAFPEEARIKKWTRSSRLKGGTLSITEDFVLDEALAPNQLNFMTWGTVDVSKPGTVVITVKDKKFHLKYDSRTFTASVETKVLDDKKLSNVWGKEVYRISLTDRKARKSGKYSYSIVRQ